MAASKLIAELASHIVGVTGALPGSDSAELVDKAKAYLAGDGEWKPIDELPEELKDGRDVLLWLGDDGPTIASWIDYSGGGYTPEGEFANWSDERGPLGYLTVTHFAEIVPPDPPDDWRSEMIHLGI